MNKTTQYIIAFLGFNLLCLTNIFSQNITEFGSKSIKYFSSDDYVAHSQNWSVMQTNNGMLYFGNNDGILQYDGVMWNRLTSTNIRCFENYNNSKIYAGGDDDFGYIEPNSKGEIKWTSLAKKIPEKYKNFVSVLSIFKINDKIVFFAFRGIFIFKNDTLLNVIQPETDFRFAFKFKNRIFIRQTDIGLMEFRNDRIYMVSNGKFFADKPIYMFLPYNNNTAMVATKKDGLFLINTENLKSYNLPVESVITKFKTEADSFFTSYYISTGTLTSDGNYAVGTVSNGLVIINKKGQIVRFFNKQSGFPISDINCVYNDRENNLWLALNNGIIFIEMNSPLNIFTEQSGFQGIPVCVKNFKNEIYVGTLSGLYVLKYSKNITKENSNYFYFKPISKEYNSIMVLDTIDNKLFAATRYGLFVVENEKLIPIKKMEFSYTLLHSKKYPNILYTNSANGISVFKKTNNKWSYIGNVKAIKHEIRNMYEENDGTLWINGNNFNIFKLNFNNIDFLKPSISIYDSTKGLPSNTDLIVYNNHKYFSVLTQLGYYKYNSGNVKGIKKDTFYKDPNFPDLMPVTNDTIRYYQSAFFKNNVAYSFTDKQGLIKISHQNGKSVITSMASDIGYKNLTYFIYPDNENNLLWFSNYKGLYSVNLNTTQKENINFITHINYLTIGKDSLVFPQNDTNIVTEIPFSKNSITINYSALFYQSSENNTFKYILEGLDEKWSEWTKEKYVSYNFLPEGTYTFRIVSQNTYRNQGQQAVFKFVVLPPWYRTIYAYFIYAVFIIIIIVLIVYFYGKQLKERNSKLETLVQIRTAEIKKQSTEIELKNLQLSEINKQLEKLSIVAREIENSVMIMDNTGKFEWVNDSFIKLYGYTFDELIKKYGQNIIDYSNYPDIKLAIKECVAKKIPYSYETTITNKENEQIWTHTTLSPILDSEGTVIKIVAIDSNISKLKQFENKLIEQNNEIQKQKQLLENANSELEKLSIAASETDNTVIIMDDKTNFLWINQSLKKKYEGEFEDIKNKNLLNSSFNPNIKKLIHKCINDKKTVIYDTETKLKSGKIYWTQTTLTPILDNNGNIKNLVAIDSDITKLKKAEEKIKIQSDELENNFKELEQKNNLISNSIEYAKKIQEAFLPTTTDFKAVFNNSFIFFKPRDIVSGDFYWTYTYNDLHFVALVDCTGHGVPGAFMSIIGSSLLNEIVRDKKITEPSQVLQMLNKGVVEALHQKEKQSTQDDGMDIVFCVINKQARTLKITATSKMAIICNNNKLASIDYDIFSIGGSFSVRKNAIYSQSEFEINAETELFLYSDGFYDQFGGINNQKLMTNKFDEFLLSISELETANQKTEVEKKFNDWKGNNKQIDDVLVIGIKFSDIYG